VTKADVPGGKKRASLQDVFSSVVLKKKRGKGESYSPSPDSMRPSRRKKKGRADK